MRSVPALVVAFLLSSLPDVARHAAADGGEEVEGWRPHAVRDEIAPRSWTERDAAGRLVLGLAGRGDAAVDGRWVREAAVAPGRTYGFRAEYRAERVASAPRSILARVVWLDASGRALRPMEYPVPDLRPRDDGWTAVGGVYPTPEAARRARLELHLRWTADGEVRWRGAELVEAPPPVPRRVHLATINHRPQGTSSAEENRNRFGRLVEQAAARGADLVVLPEGITVVGNGLSYADAAEPVPGPTTEFLGRIARGRGVWIAAGLYEREGRHVYNTAVLVARDGSLAGRYRKMSLPDEEIEGGITPGSDTPVFDTDFGRVGIMICWDAHFPEVARSLARRGAEVLLLPIWGGEESLVRARAIENQVHVVASGYDFRSGIFDREGKRVADATTDPEVVMAEVDLGQRVLWPWVGDFRSRIWREAPAWEK
jgi:predicted amidohydrolase